MARLDKRRASIVRGERQITCLRDVAEHLSEMRGRVTGLELKPSPTQEELMHSLDLAWISATRLSCEIAEDLNASAGCK